MKQKVILTCAVTGGDDTVPKFASVPFKPKQIADEAISACKAGAAIAHIHVRDPETGKPSMRLEFYREVVDHRALFQIVLGAPWGAPATTESLIAMKSLLPRDAEWAAFGVGRSEFPMVAQAFLLGGHVRVGLEDNLYLQKAVLASDNAALVTRARTIVELLGGSLATPDEAREMLGIRQVASAEGPLE